jgi:hypothetical protein
VNARVAPPVAAPFVVPTDDVRWCALLAESLSVCCILPGAERIEQIRALIDAPPPVMLPMAWDNLINEARMWLAACEIAGGAFDFAQNFRGQRMIDAALRDKPVPVPSWAARYQ